MNNYLTTKVTVKKASNVILLTIFGILFITGVAILPGQFADSTSQGIMAIVLDVILLKPFRRLCVAYRRSIFCKSIVRCQCNDESKNCQQSNCCCFCFMNTHTSPIIKNNYVIIVYMSLTLPHT